jgi:hypothetical protein
MRLCWYCLSIDPTCNQGKEGSPAARLLRVLEQRAVRCAWTQQAGKPAVLWLDSLDRSIDQQTTPKSRVETTHADQQGSGHELVQAFVATCRALGE